METGFVRRHLVQIVALAAAVGVVVALGVMALRPGSTSRRGDVGRPPVIARTAATPDRRVDEVKAAARRFVVALWDSAKTGDTSAVHSLALPDTQGDGNAGVAATISKSEHHNFIASRVDFEETSWRIDVLADQATVDVLYELYGHDADWPSLRPREEDHETPAYPAHIELERSGQEWLVTKFN